MSFVNLFAPAVSALRGNSLSFQVIGENISNSVTPGFKAADTRFQEVLASTAESDFQSLGGMRPVVQHFIDRQGLLSSTQNALDLAVNGQGFLVTNTQLDENGEYQLTRAGQFSITNVANNGVDEAYLTDLAGNFALGWPADSAGNFTALDNVAALDPLRVDPAAVIFSPVPTANTSLNAILPSGAATGDAFTAPIRVIDAAGAEHTLTLQFTKAAAPNTWSLAVSVSGGSVTSGGTATMTFDAAGNITSPLSQSIGLDFGAGGASTVALDLTAMRQFGAPFNVLGFTDDGIPAGTLQDVFFDADGVLAGNFSNGRTRALYKVPLATVINPNGLSLRSNTHFAVSDTSGALELREADQTGLGSFAPASLEQSTTDLATEFTKLVVVQQGYTTAVQAYTVFEEMLQTATDLKQ